MNTSDSILKARKENEKRIRKEHILLSAEAVMRRKGLDKVSISAVAKEAKLAPGTLYLYFKNKEDIIRELTLKALQELLKHFHTVIAQTNNPLEQIRKILLASYTFSYENELYNELVSLYEANAHLEETPALQQVSQNISSLVVSILDRAKNQDLIKANTNATHFSFIMWGTSMGMSRLIEVKKDTVKGILNEEASSLYESYIDFMIDAIKK